MFVKHPKHSLSIITPEKSLKTIHSFFDPKSRKFVKIASEIKKTICAVYEFMLILQKRFTILNVKFTQINDSVLAYLSPNIPKLPIMPNNVTFQNIYSA